MWKNHCSRMTSDCGFHGFTFSTWMFNKVMSHFTLWCHKPAVPHESMYRIECTSKILIDHIHWPPTKQNDSTVDIDDERCVSNATFSYVKPASFIWLNFYQQWTALHTVYSLLWNKMPKQQWHKTPNYAKPNTAHDWSVAWLTQWSLSASGISFFPAFL